MPPVVSPEAWERMIEAAWNGDPRLLLGTLLRPTEIESGGEGRPVPGSFVELPQDGALRFRIVRVLVFGPWKKASSFADLMLKTGWGKKKPTVSDFEVSVARFLTDMGTRDKRVAAKQVIERMAEALDVEPERLQRRVRSSRKRPAVKDLSRPGKA